MNSKWLSELKSTIIISGIFGLFFSFITLIIALIAMQDIKVAFLFSIGIWFVFFLSFFLLCSRDNRRRKKYIKNRPVEDCIKDIEKIRESGESAPVELVKMKHNIQKQNPDNERAWAWIDPVIEFHQRLAILAASEDTTPEQAEELEDEIRIFLKQYPKLKYVFLPGENLADLIRERNSKMTKEDIR